MTIEELFSSSFATEDQEEDAGIEDDAGVDIDQGTVFRLRLTGVNAELTVEAAVVIDAVDFPALAATISDDGEIVSDGDDVDFEVTIDGSDLGVVEEFDVEFDVFLDEGDDLDQETSTVNLEVRLDPVDDFDDEDSNILLYGPNGHSEDVFSILECLSFLLYQWPPNTGDGAYDTGMTLSNTGAAPDELDTQSSQTGPCNVYFYSLDGTSPAESPVTVGPLAPGETGTLVVSQVLADPFLGYAIAVCEFQWGHGYWFTSNFSPGAPFAQGAAATVLTNRKGQRDESRGQ